MWILALEILGSVLTEMDPPPTRREGECMKHLLKLGGPHPRRRWLHILDVADRLKAAAESRAAPHALLAGKTCGADVRQGVHPHPHQL